MKFEHIEESWVRRMQGIIIFIKYIFVITEYFK